MSDLPVFSLESIWNGVVSERSEREMKPRDYIYAGELGGALIDTWLKMKGVEPSNQPNARSLRKFFAGDVWEDVTKIVLAASGVLLRTQERLEYQYPGLCAVHGRLDHYAGGIPSAKRVEKYFGGMRDLEEELYQDTETGVTSLERITSRIAEMLAAKYPDGFEKIILEIKSSSTFMFEARLRRNQPDPHHALQLFHYLKSKGDQLGCIEYVNRDDALIKEFYIQRDNQDLEKEYKSRIEEISSYYQSNQAPPKEIEVSFNQDSMKFEKNWKIEYSNYLTMLYGFSEPESYREKWDKTIASFNRTFKRVVDGANMTKLNLEVISEARATFPKFDDYVDMAKSLVKVNPDLLKEETEIG